MARLHGWSITPQDIVFLPGLVCGLNVVAKAVGQAGDGVAITTPVYGPFLSAPTNQGRVLHDAPLAANRVARNGVEHWTYEVDLDALERAVQPNTRLFILCNPHNPVGRAFTPQELTALAELCVRHDLVICSDEIHCDLLLGGVRHTPMASLSPEIAARCITLMAPSKSFNMPGLGCSIAIVQDAALRKRLEQASAGIVPHVNVLGFVAATAAYTQCADWLAELQAYLTANRDFAVDYIGRHMPQLRTAVPEATYLLWLDCRDTPFAAEPQKFFLEQAKVALNDGQWFGRGGEGFVRLNFGCTRATLAEALERMRGQW
jgi:cystathionine beta-lyase